MAPWTQVWLLLISPPRKNSCQCSIYSPAVVPPQDHAVSELGWGCAETIHPKASILHLGSRSPGSGASQGQSLVFCAQPSTQASSRAIPA